MCKSKLKNMLFYVMFSMLVWFGSYGMAASKSSGNSRELDQTPTWAVAAVCTVFILISITLEKSLHKVGMWLGQKQKMALLEALEKVKAELMILGFLSLLLTFGQNYIVKICISANVADKMLPCKNIKKGTNSASSNGGEYRRKLLSYERRYLAAADTLYKCSNKGHEPLLSVNGLHQLHILIFFLAIMHVLYSAVTMLLGRLKIRGWKAWEEETLTHGYQLSNDDSKFRLTRETSFVRAHASFWNKISILFYIGCFFRQFYTAVRKVDFQTLRNGFIAVHLPPGSKFNFRNYIKRSLEDDFKVVVGVSPVLWASVVIFLLLNVNGWETRIWATLIPVVIILAVGTKLQVILAKMALEITERHAVIQGIPLVQASDRYFWFGQPQLVLHLIHFALFQIAFQITYILWTWYSFGLKNCFRIDYKLGIVQLALGIIMLCLCSYSTLPLYALVSQMGSSLKKSIFDELTAKALRKWHMAVKNKQGEGRLGKRTMPGMHMDASTTIGSSKLHSFEPTLHRSKTTGHSTPISAYQDQDQDKSDILLSPTSPSTSLVLKLDNSHEQQLEEITKQTNIEGDFKFVKSSPIEKNHDKELL